MEISVYSPVIWSNFSLPPVNLIKFRFTPCHIIDFVQSKSMKVQNQKNFKLQGRNPKRKFYMRENHKWLILQGSKTLLTLKLTFLLVTMWTISIDFHVRVSTFHVSKRILISCPNIFTHTRSQRCGNSFLFFNVSRWRCRNPC